jgi:glycosyltransferase involved in cell wall biosynthesis
VDAPLYVEASPLLADTLTGIGRFTARLVHALARRAPLCLVSTLPEYGTRLARFLPLGHELPLAPGDLPEPDADLAAWRRLLLRRPLLPHDPKRSRHSPALFTMHRPPQRHFRRELGVFYDFTPLVLPWTHAPQTVASFGAFFGQTCRLFDKALAISASTRADAGWLSALPPEDVVVGYPGPSTCVTGHAHAGPVTRSRNVVLVVSTLEERKNGPFLLDWFARTESLPADAELWWVGPKGWWASRGWLADVRRAGRRRGARRVCFLGMVSDAELCRLYRHAAFSIYPSLYEGFGFPVLDALLHGTPVACAYNSSLAEFAGPGVFYFDACGPASLDDACGALLASRQAVERDDLRRRCSWDRLAQQVLDLCGSEAAPLAA